MSWAYVFLATATTSPCRDLFLWRECKLIPQYYHAISFWVSDSCSYLAHHFCQATFPDSGRKESIIRVPKTWYRYWTAGRKEQNPLEHHNKSSLEPNRNLLLLISDEILCLQFPNPCSIPAIFLDLDCLEKQHTSIFHVTSQEELFLDYIQI